MKVQQPTNIQLISDGEGTVNVLQDGKVIRTVFCEYSLPADFVEWLTAELVEHYYSEEDYK